ncbi:F-box/kelch-repeat protein At1g80440 [Andrographis paniculata]|uniref:F-box/kelch-repeat protein At1g80440 n=1 Tax=Andrographis paniculata TaxID=175694 RepID=UPI0021E779C6|nr:F-box/kelch-repeat protein At1g80440 [Andrographis paniculata]
MVLIPGLPDEIGLECLVRVPRRSFPAVAAVCRSWNRQIRLPEFWTRRRLSGSTRGVVVLSQAVVDPTREVGSEKSVAPVYRLTVFEPGTGYWARLPAAPGCADGLPMFCRIAGVGRSLVVIGGWNPATGEVSSGVLVYDFVSGAWRRGADMPGCRRSFFACAGSNLDDRTVYVAGGHDGDKQALKSTLAYDVAGDNWSVLPDMSAERDEAEGVFHRGKFHVIGGYATSAQGRFTTSRESFDPSTCQWDPVQDDFLDSATCLKNVSGDGSGSLFWCRGADVVSREGMTWRSVGEVPGEVRKTVSFVTAWQGNVLVIGSDRFGGAHKSYVLNLKSSKWEMIRSNEEFSGHVQLGCSLDL